MSTPQFDKSKPFGTVWGGLFHGRLEQFGHLFDHEGNHLGEASQIDTNNEGPAAAPAPAAPAVDHLEAIAQAQAQSAENSSLLLKAVTLLEQAQDKVMAELQDVEDSFLDVIHRVETAGKQRAAVLAAILQTKGARQVEAANNAAAAGLTPAQAGIPSDQISAQLNA